MLEKLAVAYSFPSSSSSSHWGTSFAIILIVGLILAVFEIAGMWKVFQKAGRPGWAAIIPIYNSWILFEISGKPGWWALIGLLSIIPVFGFFAGIALLVLIIIAVLELAKRFGKSSAFAIFGMVIFPFVGFPILGFGDAKYHAGPPNHTTPTTTPPTPIAPQAS